MSGASDPQPPSPRVRLHRLKEVVRNDPSLDNRLALATAYRELGCPDQAGRWGALSEGWATPMEVDRFARLLGASGVGPREVRSFLLLPPSAEQPASVADLVSGQAEEYRLRFGIDHRVPHHVQTRALTIAEVSVPVFIAAAAVSSLVTVLVVYFTTLAGAVVSPSFARGGGAVVLLFGLAACVAWICVRVIRRRNREPAGVRYETFDSPHEGEGSELEG